MFVLLGTKAAEHSAHESSRLRIFDGKAAHKVLEVQKLFSENEAFLFDQSGCS